MQRRTVFRILSGAILVAGGLGVGLYRRRVSLDPAAATGVVDDERQMAILLALAEAMLPSETRLDASAVTAVLNLQASRVHGLLPHLTATVALLEESARQTFGVSFVALSIEQRWAVMQAAMPRFGMHSAAGWILNAALSTPEQQAFAKYILGNVNRAIYHSEAGWRAIGYRHHLGLPSDDPFAYAKPPANMP